MTNFYFKPLKSEKLQSGVCYGQFLINDLQPGQGITIGNHLRRVLLGDLGGVAISAVRIAGISHEFSTIPGVREDILEILLNLKGIIFSGNNKEIEFGRLRVQGPMVVTADLIEVPEDLEIINKTHYITTISTGTILEFEFKIEYGTGYKLASQFFKQEDENYLQLDSIFMPVQKVDFRIENVYDYEIKENKTISTKLGNLECYIVLATAKSRIGETELISYFNPKYGFVKLEYKNIDGTKTVLELENVE